MNILHLIPTYKPAYSVGGPIWSVHSLNKHLVDKGVNVTVYTTNRAVEKPVPLNRGINVDGVRVYYFPTSFPKRWEYSGKMRKALRDSIQGFDLVHITSVFRSVSTMGAYYAKKHDIPYIISPRGALMENTLGKKNTTWKKIYISLIEGRNLEGAAGIHFTVDKEKEEYLDMDLPLSKAIVIPNGLETEDLDLEADVDEFKWKHNIPKDKKVVLFLSRISWEKGLDTLIPAYKRILEENPDTILVIAGGDTGGYTGRVKELVQENDLQGRVRFTGMILEEEKVAAYKSADVFVLPSYSENFGIVCLEAMYFGIPVITTPNVGIAPQIEKAGAGKVVEKDYRTVADSVLGVLNDEDLARRMGERGKKAARTQFSMDAVTETWIDVYSDIIKEHQKKQSGDKS